MMTYVSVDIETTGLDPDKDQILQVAAVVDNDPRCPVDQLPAYEMAIQYTRIEGNPFALHMNAGLLKRIVERDHTDSPDGVASNLLEFLYRFASNHKIVAAGKNFASFDRQFLRRLHPQFNNVFHHRSIDPAMFYILPSDVVPPSTEECLRRADIIWPVTHDALDDARAVVHLIRAARAFGRLA